MTSLEHPIEPTEAPRSTAHVELGAAVSGTSPDGHALYVKVPLQANRRLTSERWGTPPEVGGPLVAEFDFDLDAAGDADLHLVPRYLTDALTGAEWPGERIFCNPPYGRKLEPFVRECQRQAATYGKLVVMLIPFRCRAAWWHDCVIGKAVEVRCVRKRIKFMRPDGTRGKFTGSCDSCVVVWDGGSADVHTRLGRFEFQEAA